MSQSLRTVLDLDSRGDPALEAAKALYSMNPDRKIWRYLGYIPRYYELLKLMRETRGRIPQLALPCRVLMSRRDEIVSPRSADYLLVNPRIDLGWLEHSDHKYYPQGDKEFMLEDFACTCRNFL